MKLNNTHYQDQLTQIRSAAKSFETKRAINKHYKNYLVWKKEQKIDLTHLGAKEEYYFEKYLLFLMDKKKKVSTIEQAKWAIDTVYKSSGLSQPGNSENIKVLLKGIRRMLGLKKTKKQAITIDHLSSIKFSETLIGIRDKALLLLGFAGALRRSELSNINCQDLEWEDFGIRVYLQKSKSNQEGKEEFTNIMKSKDKNYCPVESVKNWPNKL